MAVLLCNCSCDPHAHCGGRCPGRSRSGAALALPLCGMLLLALCWPGPGTLSAQTDGPPDRAEPAPLQTVEENGNPTADVPVASGSNSTAAAKASTAGATDDAASVEGEIGIPSDPLGILRALDLFVIPFVLASVVALWFTIERIVVLRRGRVLPRPFIERFLQHLEEGKLDPATALQRCEENGSPVASVFGHGIRKWGKPSVEVEQAIIDGGERQVSMLRKHLRVINGVATVTPLIGLLGTITGMIEAFNEIANTDAMGKAQELAGGIAVALFTTAAGLMIAIPSLIIYMYLAGRVDALVMEMDHLAQSVVHLISAEGLAGQARAAKASAQAGSSKK